MTGSIVVRTLAVDLEDCDLSAAAARRQTDLQDFLDTLEGEGLDIIAITEAVMVARYSVAEPGSYRDHSYAEPGTVYTVLCRHRPAA